MTNATQTKWDAAVNVTVTVTEKKKPSLLSRMWNRVKMFFSGLVEKPQEFYLAHKPVILNSLGILVCLIIMIVQAYVCWWIHPYFGIYCIVCQVIGAISGFVYVMNR